MLQSVCRAVGAASRNVGRPVLYAIDDATNSLLTINPVTYAISVVGSTGVASGDFGDLTYDSNHGVMYWDSGRGDNSIYTLNLSTGAATLVGATGLTDLLTTPRTTHCTAPRRQATFTASTHPRERRRSLGPMANTQADWRTTRPTTPCTNSARALGCSIRSTSVLEPQRKCRPGLGSSTMAASPGTLYWEFFGSTTGAKTYISSTAPSPVIPWWQPTEIRWMASHL